MTTMRRLSVIAATLGTAAQLTGAAIPAPKKGFVADIEALTDGNTDFRRVLYTGMKMQLVLMALAPGEDIGEEIHQDVDQFFRGRKVKERSGSTASLPA